MYQTKKIAQTVFLCLALFYSPAIFPFSTSQDSSSVLIQVGSSNLSEDFSAVSTKNDELLFIIFEYKDSISDLGKPVFCRQFTFNPDTTSVSFLWHNYQENKFYFYFLIELDSDISHLQLYPILSAHHRKIIKSHEDNDYNELEKYLGDEDVIAYGNIRIPSESLFSKIYKLDRYNYKMSYYFQK